MSFQKFKNMVLGIKPKLAKLINTIALLNTIIEGFLVMLIGGAMYVLTYIFTGEMIIVANGIVGLPANVSSGMVGGIGMLLAGLQVMGIVFFVVGLVVVVRALLSIYGNTGGQPGGKY
jgi:hypothetical protein